MRFNSIGGALLLFLCAGFANAQTSAGTIKGVVVDSSGAVLQAAEVEVTESATSLVRKQATNQDGIFEFPLIPRGTYTLSVSKSGFRKETLADIPLQVAEVRDLRITMSLGELSQSVSVDSSGTVLESSNAALSQVIDPKRVSQLPINGRNMMQLLGLAPGVTVAARASATQRQANYGPSFTMGGQRDNTSIVLVDGIEISGMEMNNYPLAIPSLESIAEFRVVTSNASAEFGGNSGAIVNVASKTGSNQLHGDAFEFLRNEDLDAKNFFSTQVTPLKRNQFGGVISGPVMIPKLYSGKDRTFWMFSYEGTRQVTAQANTASVPADAIRQGDFSSIRQAGLQIVDPVSKTPFANNMIPASKLSPFGLALTKFWPQANSGDPIRNYYALSPSTNNSDIIAARIDHRFSASNSMFGRITLNNVDGRSPGQGGIFAGFDAIQSDGNLQAVLSDNHIFSPTVVNELNVGFVRFHRDRNSQDAGKRNWLQELGVAGIPSDNPFTWGAPFLSVTGYTGTGYASSNSYFRWLSQSQQTVDNLTIIRGKHTFKVGGSFSARRNDSTQWLTPNGSYTFTGVFSTRPPATTTNQYNAFADLLMADPSAYAVQTAPYLLRLQNYQISAYGQDDWRVTPNLTLNLGLRWEYFGKPADRYGRIASFDLNSGMQIFPGQNNLPNSFIHPDLNDFGPRLGLAWKPGGSQRLVVRAAYGIFYSPEVVNSYINLGLQNPFGQQYNRILSANAGTSPLPYFSATNPIIGLSTTTSNALKGVDPNLRDGYVGNWNATIQFKVSDSTIVEAGYRGSKGTRLSSFLNYNETNPYPAQPPAFTLYYPYPSLSTLNILESRGNSTYHAFQARIERRYSKGFTVLASYTWEKTLTDIDQSTVGLAGGTGNAYPPQTIQNLRLNKGRSPFDRPLSFNFSALYDLPFLRQNTSILGRTLGGWQVGLQGIYAKGNYLTPASYANTFGGTRASYIGDPNLPSDQRTLNAWYDVTKVVNSAPGTLGNAGKGTILGSGIDRLDFIVDKNFRIAETRRLELRGEFFNLFNTPQFDDPVLGPLTNPQAGHVTSASDYGYSQTERVIQIALKFHF
jgi:hypothetical protein